ncbi:hypothetical protein BH23ACT9_BH23ACT9_24850 [soil metagenome]
MRGRGDVRMTALAVALVLMAAACGGGGDDTAETTATATPVATAIETETPSEEPKEEPSVAAPTASPTTPEPAEQATPLPTVPVDPAPADTSDLDAASDAMGVGGETTYGSYVAVTDDTGAISVEIPAEWADVDGRPYTDEAGRDFFDVRASTDLEGFAGTWDVPGIIVNASTDAAQSLNEEALLDQRLELFSEQCDYLGRQPYADPLYTGQADVFENCGGTQTGYLILGAVPTSRAFLIRVEVQVVDERDIEALARALETFIITGDV